MTLGDRIAVMRDGLVQQFGTPDDIYSRPATRFVAEFIGSPAMNIIDSQRAADGLSSQGVPLLLNDAQRGALQSTNGAGISYGLRPESLSFAEQGLAGTISMLEPTGPETYAMVDTAVGKLTARVAGKVHQHVGDSVHLRWQPEDAHLFDAKSEQRVVG